jgi:hypothetical protein
MSVVQPHGVNHTLLSTSTLSCRECSGCRLSRLRLQPNPTATECNLTVLHGTLNAENDLWGYNRWAMDRAWLLVDWTCICYFHDVVSTPGERKSRRGHLA